MRRKFLAETIRNFGVGLMIGAFLLPYYQRRIKVKVDWTLVLMAIFGSVALWSMGLYVIWQEKKKGRKAV